MSHKGPRCRCVNAKGYYTRGEGHRKEVFVQRYGRPGLLARDHRVGA